VSATPRTDAETHEWHYGYQCMEKSQFGDWVGADFARALERELAEAHSTLREIILADSLNDARAIARAALQKVQS